MSRIPYADLHDLPESTRNALAGRRQINVFKMIANSTNAAPDVLALGRTMSVGSSLPPIEREIVILRVAHLTNAEYMAHEHHTVALRHGFSESKIASVALYPDDRALADLDDFERQLIDFTDAVVRTGNAPDEPFNAMELHYDRSRLVELVMLIGFYMMVGRVMNTFALELEDGPVDTFPQDWAH